MNSPDEHPEPPPPTRPEFKPPPPTPKTRLDQARPRPAQPPQPERGLLGSARSDHARPEQGGQPEQGQAPYRQPESGKPQNERDDATYSRPQPNRSEYERPTSGGPGYGRPESGGSEYERSGSGGSGYGRPGSGGSEYGRSESGRSEYERSGSGGSEYGRSESSRAEYGRPGSGGSEYGRPGSGQSAYGGAEQGRSEYGQAAYGQGDDGQPVEELALGSISRRAGARLIDTGLLGIAGFAVILPFMIAAVGLDEPGSHVRESGGVWSGTAIVGWILVLAVLPFAYEAIQLALWGQTIGKHILHLRVLTAEGETLPTGQAIARAATNNVLYLLGCGLGTLMAYLWAIWDQPLHQALHDRLAGTLVADDRDFDPDPDPDQ